MLLNIHIMCLGIYRNDEKCPIRYIVKRTQSVPRETSLYHFADASNIVVKGSITPRIRWIFRLKRSEYPRKSVVKGSITYLLHRIGIQTPSICKRKYFTPRNSESHASVPSVRNSAGP